MHWAEYVPQYDIRFHNGSRNCEQGRTMEYSTETRVLWPLCQARTCFVYRNECIRQLKRRTLRTIWSWNGMKLVCVLSPTRFSIFLFIDLSDVFSDSPQRSSTQSRPDANLFNASQFKSARKIWNILVCGFMFANITAFVVHNYQDVREISTRVSRSLKASGLEINLKKSKPFTLL